MGMGNRLVGEILNACDELIDSARELVRETLPHNHLPEPTVFVIADGIFWPAQVRCLRLSETPSSSRMKRAGSIPAHPN